ncbi:hypothetical protein DMB66_53280 [Actinoplanes sp. ATCC 53533]|nr:hypothetical protein DMB66_53280 [Actinoplanes sp. ATCC 53533]
MDELFVDLDLAQDVVAAADAVSRELFGRWSVSWQTGQGMVSCPVRDLASVPVTGMQPVRRFAWRTGQRHRPGLQFMVSTGRHHGFESLAEQ